MTSDRGQIPIQSVEKPIICSPYDEPTDHWVYDKDSGLPEKVGHRREAGYWYKTDRTGSMQGEFFAQEERDDLPLVNLLRKDVRRWREAGYRGASNVTKRLLQHWSKEDLPRRLFFCQREAVETVIYLAEMRIPGRSRKTGFQTFELRDDDLQALLQGKRPGFTSEGSDFFPSLADSPDASNSKAILRLGCKMATGSGKTVVMAMLIAWAFCNRGMNPRSREFPNAALVCCPNLTVKERLQVLRPDRPGNYYAEFNIVPARYQHLLQRGRVLVTNWHVFAPEAGNKEGGRSFGVVDKGPETPEVFAHRVLRNLAERLPIMVFNDEGHHCWRARSSENMESTASEERKEFEAERAEATVWVEGLDRLNSMDIDGSGGIKFCIDLSATPFYIRGSGHPEGYPFPWLVSDFSLVDAIESGIVKIPRLPVQDVTGRPDPKYFRLWETIRENLESADYLPGRSKKPKPEKVYREAEAALLQIAGQWVERFQYIQESAPGQDRVPPVLIVVCDNTEIAEVFFRNISGEAEIEVSNRSGGTAEDREESGAVARKVRRTSGGPRKEIGFGHGQVFPEFFANSPDIRRTIRIDSKLLSEAEGSGRGGTRQDAAEELRRIVATVGRQGEPGEHVRCVVSVAMLNEGWDASNVTQVLGVRAFGSQLLCEQVVGRGLRRMDYVPDPDTGLLTEEYVDVYGIPFSVVPFKGRASNQKQPEDKPKQHVFALPDRSQMEMRFPVVEGYAFSLKKNLIKCDVDSMERLVVQPDRQPTATFVSAAVGYQEGSPATGGGFSFEQQDRQQFYDSTHLQTIKFQVARQIVNQLTSGDLEEGDVRRRAFQFQSRHQLFPEVFRYVDEYIERKVEFQNVDPRELGLQEYTERLVERVRDGIMPDDAEGEPPLLPLLNRNKPIATSSNVDFKTSRSCVATVSSHVNQVVLDTKTWEAIAVSKIEQAVQSGIAEHYVRNDGMGLFVPYEYLGVSHDYQPDFLVRIKSTDTVFTLILEIKGLEDDKDKAKHQAALRWVAAVNNWGKLGVWEFHVCRNPQVLDKELKFLAKKFSEPKNVKSSDRK